MNIKEMSNSDLINELVFAIKDEEPEYQFIEAELLSRLELGRKAIDIVDELHASFTIETPQHLIDMVMDFVKDREGLK